MTVVESNTESTFRRKEHSMKKSIYTNYDELPLFLNAETVANLLGISISGSYELMHEKEFPSMRIGSRLIVPKEKFIEWANKQSERSK